MSEIEKLRSELDEVKRQLIMLQQHASIATRNATRSEPSGTSTVGELSQISDTQLDDNPALYVEHAEGGMRANMSQIVDKAQQNIPAENIKSGTLDAHRIPFAVNSQQPDSGCGGFRYVLDGTTLKLFVS